MQFGLCSNWGGGEISSLETATIKLFPGECDKQIEIAKEILAYMGNLPDLPQNILCADEPVYMCAYFLTQKSAS
jgi:hypothetical protein